MSDEPADPPAGAKPPGTKPPGQRARGGEGGPKGSWGLDGLTDTDVSANTIRLERPFVLEPGRRRASLILIRGGDVGLEHPLISATCAIGRDPESDVTIEDEMTSRQHAELAAVGTGDEIRHIVRDLGSTNGTLVNNRKVSEVELRDGDRIIVGETILLYRVLDEVDIGYQEEIRKLIRYHDLTGFLTLKEFYKILRRGIRRASEGDAFSILMVDVDNLSEINGLYGHLAGSAVVRRIGELFRGELSQHEAVGIYGGDEFVCYLPEADADAGFETAERLRNAVESDALTHDGIRLPFTVCIGVAQYPVHGTKIQALVRSADQALYRAKALGRNRAVVAEGSAG